MGELDVAANGSHLLGLFEKLTYAGPHFCEQSRHGFLNVERLLAERVHQILVAVALWAYFQGGDVDKGLAELETPAKVMIDDLLWWTTALKTARKA